MKGSNKGFYEKFHKDVRLQKRVISDDNFTYKSIIEVLRKIIPILKGKSVLDVGCGVGTIDFYLAKQNFEVLGIDLSEKAIRMSILNAKHLGLEGKTSFKSGDFLRESFDKKFDLIICSEVIEHVKDDDNFITKAHVLLKKNGLILVTTPSDNSWLFKMRFLRKVDKKGGHLRRYSMDVLENKFRRHDFKIITKKKTDGLLRNLLFSFKTFDIVNKAANTVPVISKTLSSIDRSLIPLFGETDLILVAKLVEKPEGIAYNWFRMKIGIDGRYAEGKLTGVGQYIERLVQGLAEKGQEIVLFYTKPPLNPIVGKNIYSVVLLSKNRYIFEQILLPSALKKEKVDLYHAAGNLGVPLFCPVPSVLTVHDIIPLLYPNYFSFAKIPLVSKTSFFLRTASSVFKADKVVADSQFTKDCLVKKFGIKPEKVAVIPLGIEPKESKTKLPEGITKGKYIINNGGIDIRKNLFRLIEAFAKISPKFSGMKLVITGENPDLLPKLEEKAAELKIAERVVFPGYVSEEVLWALLKNAACLCLPSEIEGFGFPVLAGMAAGTPVVASNASCLPEIADEAAILVNPASTEEIAVGLEKVLKDKALADSLIKKGLVQAKKFTWEKTVQETIAVYQEL